MARATKAEKAQHLNAARGLLQRQLARADAVRKLSREFDLSERQAYRYIEQASQLNRPAEVPENRCALRILRAWTASFAHLPSFNLVSKTRTLRFLTQAA
jgi:hypothetical protein